MEIIIDGERIKTTDDFHLEIKEKLEFPDYYGENLDALWDCLTGSIDLPVTLVWDNADLSKEFPVAQLLQNNNFEIIDIDRK